MSEKTEWLKCKYSFPYFVDTYGVVQDAVIGDWVAFKLWYGQLLVAEVLQEYMQIVILKARQLGMTWLVLWFALWLMLFHPMATILIFSRRDTEAVYLLAGRLKIMYSYLPAHLKCRRVIIDSDHEWSLSNGSTARAFPTTAGDSYNATLVIVDEADLVPDLGTLLASVKPTIDNGGAIILLSRVDKKTPKSEFKNIYRAAKKNLNDWVSVFLPWHTHPARDDAWYESQKRDAYARKGSLDVLYEQYPATDAEALAPNSLDKRLAPHWINQCYVPIQPFVPRNSPAINGLVIYKAPEPGHTYVQGLDPAEGNPTSDDSALVVLDVDSGEECAHLNGKLQPSVICGHADTIGVYYNNAAIMVERNNHGSACLLWFRDNSNLDILLGHDDKEGWMSSTKGKKLLYNTCADAFRDNQTILHSDDVHYQITSIEGSSLRAPEGENEDLADAYSLALCARNAESAGGTLEVAMNPMQDYRG